MVIYYPMQKRFPMEWGGNNPFTKCSFFGPSPNRKRPFPAGFFSKLCVDSEILPWISSAKTHGPQLMQGLPS